MELQIGMMWFDADEEFSLLARAHNGVKHYFSKHGNMPDTILMSEKDLDEEMEMEGIRIIPSKRILKYHFYIGVANDQ